MLLKIREIQFLYKSFEFEKKLSIFLDLLCLISLMYKRSITNWVTVYGQSFKARGGNLRSRFLKKSTMLFLVLV